MTGWRLRWKVQAVVASCIAYVLHMAQVIDRSRDYDVYHWEKATRITARASCVEMGRQRAY